MTTHRSPAAGPAVVPPVLASWLSAFRDGFTAPVWKRVLVLVAGAVLPPRKRTLRKALRVMGLAARPGFARYHEVLSRARWNGRAVTRRLLVQGLDVFLPAGEVVIGIDDTIERRWGAKIKARGIYPRSGALIARPLRQGLRWLSLMVVVPAPWAGRCWALPFLMVLAPSERWILRAVEDGASPLIEAAMTVPAAEAAITQFRPLGSRGYSGSLLGNRRDREEKMTSLPSSLAFNTASPGADTPRDATHDWHFARGLGGLFCAFPNMEFLNQR